MNCEVPIMFAFVSSIYMIASIIYLIAITVDIVKSPVAEAVKDYPELEKIRNTSKKTRRNLFYISLVLATILLVIFNPFTPMNKAVSNKYIINDVSDIEIIN